MTTHIHLNRTKARDAIPAYSEAIRYYNHGGAYAHLAK